MHMEPVRDRHVSVWQAAQDRTAGNRPDFWECEILPLSRFRVGYWTMDRRRVSLRPIVEDQLGLLTPLLWDPGQPGDFQWFGYRIGSARHLERRWHDDGLVSTAGDEPSFLAVMIDGNDCAGWVTWRPAGKTGNYEIGAALFPEFRRQGIGTEAQRQLVDYLFATTPANRLQAGTESENVAEQKSLEVVGFRREGVQRGLYFRGGQWRDSVMYGIVRGDVSST